MALSRNDIARYLFVFIWWGINGALFASTFINYGTSKKYHYLRTIVKGGLPYARGAAMVLNFNCMLVLLSMCRNIISFIRSNLNCGWCGVVHICGHYFNLTNLTESQHRGNTEIEQHLSQLDNPWLNPIRESGVVSFINPVTGVFSTVAGVTGVIMTLSLILMVSSATELIRRSFFETFWFTHHLFVVFFGCLVVHGVCYVFKPTWMNMILRSAMMSTFGRIIQPTDYKIRPQLTAPEAMVIKHPSKVLEIQMKKEGFRCEAGQYIFLKCKKISQLEWHPFTLTSAPEESYFSVHIRSAGDWTDGLHKAFDCNDCLMKDIGSCPRLAVDGPFGTSSTDVFKYDVIMCIGAGIGVTPFASILKSVWYRHNQRYADLKIKKVYFFWICRDTNAFEWFTDLLGHLEIQMATMNMNDFVEYHIYLTGWDTKLAIQSSMHQGAADNITNLEAKTQYGRPAWSKIFKDIAAKHKGVNRTEIGVFFCGPSVLSHVLHKNANQYSDVKNGVKFSYHKENF
ncbi:hypothetical protein OS493_009615 [Desmophyllum pertusum]|uniref:FAD-binding FR-type domain-containing protein n=1 Tax=Desmophyllum pertusum TaxID=174260 RepID=A0A9W9YQY0_9CNID|nr:hypothetical protein OS493_009615 [Desmophyllum pertusum]